MQNIKKGLSYLRIREEEYNSGCDLLVKTKEKTNFIALLNRMPEYLTFVKEKQKIKCENLTWSYVRFCLVWFGLVMHRTRGQYLLG